MTVNTLEKRASVLSYNRYGPAPTVASGGVADLSQRASVFWNYSGISVPELEARSMLLNDTSRSDQFVFNHGKMFILNVVSTKPDALTGDYELDEKRRVWLRRVWTKDSKSGKSRLYMTTLKANAGMKPVPNMRVKRNGIEHKYMRVTPQGDNAFFIITETIVGGSF